MGIFNFYKICFLLIIAFSPVCFNNGFSTEKSTNAQIQEIDQKIDNLEEMKRGYESKAIKQANQAQRLQFIEGELQTAKRYWNLSENNKKIAVRIQREIDELKIERLKLLKKKE